MPNILQTVLDVSPITIKQNFRHPKFLTDLYRNQNDRKSAIS